MKKNYTLLRSLISVFLFLTLKLSAQCSSVSTVPYFEGFQNITSNNQLPACWSSSGMGSTCGTFTSSNGFASFYCSPAATSYFYSNNIQLNPGVTYSASVWYSTNANGGTNWTNFSLMLGNTQSPLNPVNIASVSPAIASFPSALSNTFSVPSAGLYYMIVKATSNGGNASPLLSWDDLSITIPCTISGNNPTVNISANSTTICSGQSYSQITFTATGADTYSWNTGATTAITSPVASSPNPYVVSGTSTLSGCSSTATIGITVFPTPSMTLVLSAASICFGNTATFNAFGASNYSWSTGQTGPNISVSPTISTSYTVTGTSTAGCASNEVLILGVIPPPSITHSPSITNLCSGETYTFIADGAITYTWIAPGGVSNFNNPFVISQLIPGNYTLTGRDGNGCVNSEQFNLSVSLCTSVKEGNWVLSGQKIYPNPNAGEFSVELDDKNVDQICIYDVSGRIIFTTRVNVIQKNISINIRDYDSGIYYLTLYSEQKSTTYQIVKN